MPKDKKLNAADRQQLRAAEIQLFIKATGRKKRDNGGDPNDRRVDPRTTKAVRHMRPEQFDELLRDGEE